MSESGWDVSFDAVASILFDEFDAPSSMSPKAFYKIVYFIDKELTAREYTTSIDHFWYKYGTMTVTAGSAVAVEPSGDRSEVLCSATPAELELDPEVESEVRSVTRDVLERHERLKTEGLTDLMYEEAPFEFQRSYRRLDKIIQTGISNNGKDSREFNREAIREEMHEFIDAFPEGEFHEFINDLYLWYDVFSTALDDGTTELDDVEDIAEIFWAIIMIEVATRPRTGVNSRVFANELNIDDPEGLQSYLRYRLSQLEDEYLSIDNTEDSMGEVVDAVMVSQLDFVEI